MASTDSHHIFKYFSRKKKSSTSSSSSTSSVMNKASGAPCSFVVGVAEEKNKKCRRTMEDAHTYIHSFANVPDSGYFAVFDGHAGHACADYCSKTMHGAVESWIRTMDASKQIPKPTVSHALNEAFQEIDAQVGKMTIQNSGTTAAVAVVRWEQSDSKLLSPVAKNAEKPSSAVSDLPSPSSSTASLATSASKRGRRMLYVANVGDTRVVLCRRGKAIRLTYDHKGSDAHESKRIVNSGGIMMNNRVNGVLAVTRALGDTFMKEFVCSAPYTTEVELEHKDEFLIIACDGLWDVCNDSKAVELVRNIRDPKEASEALVAYALENFSTDNLTVMVVRFDQDAIPQSAESVDVSTIPSPVDAPDSSIIPVASSPRDPEIADVFQKLVMQENAR